jgi:GNAT superfamily N-acetyltransferase
MAENIDIRWATPEDAPSIADIIDQTYQWGVRDNPEKWNGWIEYIGTLLLHFRVLFFCNQPIGVCKTGGRFLQYGQAVLSSAEVSEISILPIYQRRGFGLALMTDFIALMNDNDIALSRLSARNIERLPFYNRCGFFRFPSRHVNIKVDEIRGHGNSTKGVVRPFETGSDLSACAQLYNSFSRQYSCSLVWDQSQGGWNHPYRLVYEDEQGVCGYLYADSAFGAISYDQIRPKILEDLIRELLRIAKRDGLEDIILRLPQAPEIVQQLEDIGVEAQFCESYPDIDINMLYIPSLQRFIRQALPELENCIRKANQNGRCNVLRIETNTEHVDLEIDHSGIQIIEAKRPSIKLKVGIDHLLQLFLGSASIGDFIEDKLIGGDRVLLESLFPKRIATAGNEIWGGDNLNLTQYPILKLKTLN